MKLIRKRRSVHDNPTRKIIEATLDYAEDFVWAYIEEMSSDVAVAFDSMNTMIVNQLKERT